MNFENLQIAVNDLPKAEELEFTRLHKDLKSVRLLGTILFTIVLMIGGVVVLALSGRLFEVNSWLIAIGGPFAYFMLAVLFIYKSFPIKGYVIRDRDIAYRSGLIFRSITSVPYNRIQHCELTQGPIEKTFDLCKVVIYTAGGSDSELDIPGLLYSEGETIREFLMAKIAANAIN